MLSSANQKSIGKVKELIGNTEKILKDYDLRRGWFGAQTLLKSVTCTPGHPLDVIGRGMNEGNSWFVFAGYMEFLAKQEIAHWVEDAKLNVVTDVGFSTKNYPSIFGCENHTSVWANPGTNGSLQGLLI